MSTSASLCLWSILAISSLRFLMSGLWYRKQSLLWITFKSRWRWNSSNFFFTCWEKSHHISIISFKRFYVFIQQFLFWDDTVSTKVFSIYHIKDLNAWKWCNGSMKQCKYSRLISVYPFLDAIDFLSKGLFTNYSFLIGNGKLFFASYSNYIDKLG